MMMKYFIANWKANKNLKEVEEWLNLFLKLYRPVKEKVIVICPPAFLLTYLQSRIKLIPNIKIGVQNISHFEEGPYTGEITAKSLTSLADFVIIGHSERRKYFNETKQIIEKKISLAYKYQIEPILCIRNENDWLADKKIRYVAYEPVYAIGTGNNEPLEKVIQLKNKLNLSLTTSFLYGGSVNDTNAKQYLSSNQIAGLLIGEASLDPRMFYRIISTI